MAKQKVLKDFTAKEYMNFRKQGLYNDEIAEKIFVSRVTLQRWLSDNGIKTPNPRVKYDEKTRERIVNLYKTVMNYREVARNIGCDDKTVRNYVKEAEVKGKLLSDLTIERYSELKKELGEEQKIADYLFVSLGTLWNWKRSKGLIGLELQERRRKNKEKVNAYKKLKEQGKVNEEIVEIMEFRSKSHLWDWVSNRRREGYDL